VVGEPGRTACQIATLSVDWISCEKNLGWYIQTVHPHPCSGGVTSVQSYIPRRSGGGKAKRSHRHQFVRVAFHARSDAFHNPSHPMLSSLLFTLRGKSLGATPALLDGKRTRVLPHIIFEAEEGGLGTNVLHNAHQRGVLMVGTGCGLAVGLA
jgi:hypothetical protein